MSVVHPRISVIMAHYNYARFAGSALLSVIQQSLSDWEALVVDDCSSPDQFATLEVVVRQLGDDRIRLLRNHENQGQIHSIFHGVREARGDFVALLDPDDLYEPMFLDIMHTALLNNTHNAGIAACEMGIFSDVMGVTSHHSTRFRMGAVSDGRYDQVTENQLLNGFSEYFPPWKTGWHWASTSGMMLRRSILEAVAPQQAIDFTRFEGDAYCALGCHMLGGTVFVDQMLSWRRIHDRNTAKNPVLVFDNQNRMKPEFENTLWDVTLLVAETILSNPDLVRSAGSTVSAVVAHLGQEGLAIITGRNPATNDALFEYSFGGI
ncbi:glycosyltransferase family 2 protein [Sinorhizobium fredii]|uniref:glycosyltransferase family 2 protein n=1 Tax=Rhizobium fredii TaxID=380 RepID=UPI0004AD9494|nr:glycosyltransferase [Sinorhizobium fredii]